MAKTTKVEKADIVTARKAARARDSLAVRTMGWLSEAADQPQLISVCSATALIGMARRDRRLFATGMRMLAAELAATAIKGAVKRRIDRTRPRVDEDGGRYRMESGDGDDDSDTNSFPSGHTAGAVAVARVVARGYPRYGPAAYCVAAGVAAIQVPRCQHYPSDLAAGVIVGLAADVSVRIAERALDRATSIVLR